MIGYLKGTVLRKTPPEIILDVNGVGYKITLSMYSIYKLPAVKGEVGLEIYTQVKEDAINLYGFTELEEKKVFEKLISASKVGCKLAINILSGGDYKDICQTIYEGDANKLKQLPGIGLKTAQRLIVELQGKLELPSGITSPSDGVAIPASSLVSDLKSAFSNLGYGEREITKVVAELKQDIVEESPLEDLVKNGLKLLLKK